MPSAAGSSSAEKEHPGRVKPAGVLPFLGQLEFGHIAILKNTDRVWSVLFIKCLQKIFRLHYWRLLMQSQ